MRITVTLLALFASLLTQGCGAIGKLHTQAGFVVGKNYGDESLRGFSETQGVAELGYVTGESKSDFPRWDFGGTSYLALTDPMRPGGKAIARRRFNPKLDLDISAGPMITYESSGPFNGFIGGVALNVSFVTLRSEYMSWPTEPWDEYTYENGVIASVISHPSGHEQIWFNGLSFNGTASWVTAAIVTAVFIAAAAGGAFE